MRVWQEWRKWERGHIPPHLSRLYPTDLSLILLNIALFLDAWAFTLINLVIVAGAAGGSALLLLHGWLADRPDFTVAGALVACVVWLVAIINALTTFESQSSFVVASTVIGFAASLNLAAGLAWVVGKKGDE